MERPGAATGTAADGTDPVDRKRRRRRDLRAARRAHHAGAGDERSGPDEPSERSGPDERSEQRGHDEAARRTARESLAAAAAPLVALLVERARDGGPVTVAAFHPMPTEPDVLAVVAEIRAAVPGLRVIFPAAGKGPDLDWVLWDGRSSFETSPGTGFGAEPGGLRLGADGIAEADLVLAPALAVDRSGTRIGHGGGYYDRALPRRRDGVRVIAVVHPEELLPAGALVREEHDVPVDAVLTADGLTQLGG